MATSGDRYLATSGDFFMATDTRLGVKNATTVPRRAAVLRAEHEARS